MHVMQTP